MAEAGVTVRPARLEDYQAAESIMEQVHALHVGWCPDVYRPCKVVLPVEEYQQLIDTGRAFVAEADGKPVGILHVNYRHIEGESHVTQNIVFADVVAVDEPYRGQGIGRALLAHMKRLKEEKQLDGMMLQVNSRNQAALQMYERCGFVPWSINLKLKE